MSRSIIKQNSSFEENVRPVLVLPFPIKRGRKGGEDAAVYFRSHDREVSLPLIRKLSTLPGYVWEPGRKHKIVVMFWCCCVEVVAFDHHRGEQAQLTLGKLTALAASRHHLCFEACEMIAAVCVCLKKEKT
jgi:hypothetical protein